ncbi:MAG: hypothetical protein ABI969_19065 [bacterium]
MSESSERRIYHCNRAQTGMDDGRLLAITMRNQRGRLIAGL